MALTDMKIELNLYKPYRLSYLEVLGTVVIVLKLRNLILGQGEMLE